MNGARELDGEDSAVSRLLGVNLLTGAIHNTGEEYKKLRSVSDLLTDLVSVPADLSRASKYMVLNGVIYLASGLLLLIWPGLTQTLFIERAFLGDEQGLIRVTGLTVAVIGWFYVFGGRSGAHQMVAASVVNRLTFVPLVLVVLAMAGIFSHLLLFFALLNAALAVGAWLMLSSARRG